jgi:hypothetical protein
MKITESTVRKFTINDVPRLDPIIVYLDKYSEKEGRITIQCWNQVWSNYWGAMSEPLMDFFINSHAAYIIGKLDPNLGSEVYDADAMQTQAEEKGIEWCYRGDPWNDDYFMYNMYGPDPMDWDHQIPTKPNHEYTYLKRIVLAVQEAFKEMRNGN